MTNSDYTHIAIIADRSASMGEFSEPPHTKAEDTTRGIQELITGQAALAGKLTISLVDFMIPGGMKAAADIRRVAWFASPEDQTLRAWVCRPSGGTPLLDAVGTVITDTGQALEAMPEDARPGRVIFVIGTDGEENRSAEYKLAQVEEMITHQQQRYGWDFIFIGVGIDAFEDAGGMGVAMAATMDASPAGTAKAYMSTNSAVTRSRIGGQSVSYSDTERAAVKEKD